MATLYTDVVEMRAPGAPTEGGVFELEVLIDETEMRKSGAPQSFFFRELAMHLAQAMLDTGIPRQYWWAEFTNEARTRFNLPKRADMEKG